MSRSFLERLKDPVWWLEHAAHGWIGGVVALIAGSLTYVYGPGAVGAFWAGVIAAGVVAIGREFVQNVGDSDNNIPDAVADTLFTSLGGWLASIPWALVAWT